jgi:hypothetical protein
MNTYEINKREPRRANDQHSTELASRISDRAQQQRPVGALEEAQAGELGPELLVVADGGGGVPGVQAHVGV